MLFQIGANLKKTRISDVIDFLGSRIKYFSITVRCDRIGIWRLQPDIVDRVITSLSSFQIEKKESNWWPGTELLEGHADVYIYNCNEKSIRLLENESEFVGGWKRTQLPEDLAFYNENMRELFYSRTRDNECQYILSESELENLNSRKTPKPVALVNYEMIGRFSSEDLRVLKRVFIGFADIEVRDPALTRKGRYPGFKGGCALVACHAFKADEFVQECGPLLEKEGFFLKEVVDVRDLVAWLLLEGLTDSELKSLLKEIGFKDYDFRTLYKTSDLQSLLEEVGAEGREGPYDFWLLEID